MAPNSPQRSAIQVIAWRKQKNLRMSRYLHVNSKHDSIGAVPNLMATEALKVSETSKMHHRDEK